MNVTWRGNAAVTKTVAGAESFHTVCIFACVAIDDTVIIWSNMEAGSCFSRWDLAIIIMMNSSAIITGMAADVTHNLLNFESSSAMRA